MVSVRHAQGEGETRRGDRAASGAERQLAAAGALVRLNLLTFSTLFPNAAAPNHGIFVETRLRNLVSDQPVQSTVVAPVPYFPFRSRAFGSWSRHARAPRFEVRSGIAVHHPRYLVIPRIGMASAPALLYGAALGTMKRLLLLGLKIDAIDAHYVYPDGVAAVWLGRRLGLPVVVTARGSDVTLYPDYVVPRRLIRRTIAAADHLIAVSEALKRRLVLLGARGDGVTVLRNGVDPQLFRPLPRDEARAKLGLPPHMIVSVGHLIERKGHHHVIAALSALPGVNLVIVGEGPERDRLKALAERLRVGERVHFAGAVRQAELPLYYSAAEALVLASSREGWANVLLEAMACGTPAVASNAEGNSEVVRTREAGRILSETTPRAIASAVRDVLDAPPERTATRAYAEQFGWEAVSAGQMTVFEAAILGHGRRRAGVIEQPVAMSDAK